MNASTLAALAIVAAGYALTRPAPAASLWDGLAGINSIPEYPEPDQLPGALETLAISMDPSTYLTGTLPGDLAGVNVRAFLDAIASPTAEGTAHLGDNGYNVLFGGGLFFSYADHPRQLIPFTDARTGEVNYSSAAGRYQILRRTFDALAAKLGTQGFAPDVQDAMAIELIAERGALADVRAGRFADAVHKCRRIWASLPGAGYDQHETTLARLAQAFTAAGGTITA
jgi:lysozyme